MRQLGASRWARLVQGKFKREARSRALHFVKNYPELNQSIEGASTEKYTKKFGTNNSSPAATVIEMAP
jgi:hypothetical protein